MDKITPINKRTLSIDECGQLLTRIKEQPLETLQQAVDTLGLAELNEHSFSCLKKAVHYYAQHCQTLNVDESYDIILSSSLPLRELSHQLTQCLDEHQDALKLRPKEIECMKKDVAEIHKRIIKASLISARSIIATQDTKAMLLQILLIADNVTSLCFTEDFLVNPTVEFSLEEIHQGINALISNTNQYINPGWVNTEENKKILDSIKTKYLLLIEVLLSNNANLDTLENTQRLCVVLKTKAGRLTRPNTSTNTTHFAKPEQGIRKNDTLSRVKANFYDFDNTLYLNKAKSIPEKINQQLRVLHQTLKIQAHIITARNDEMENQDYYAMDPKSNTVYIRKREYHDSIPGIIEKHNLHDVIPQREITYCDFYHKVPVENHPEYTYYFDYCGPNCKTSKVGDYEVSVSKRGIHPSHTAIFDDNQSVWPNIENHTKNFFHINNKSISGSLTRYLNDEIVQLVLYGEHLRLHNRLLAATESLTLGFFKNHPRESAALQKFIQENQEQCLTERFALIRTN